MNIYAEEEGQPFLPALYIIPTSFHHIQVVPSFKKKTLNVLNQKYLDTSSSCPAFGQSANTGKLFLPNMLIQRSLFWCLGICLNINPHPAD